jgi:two-component system, sensor histidine kinase and response regulator
MTESTAPAPLLLVVDDNPLNVEPLCDLLSSMGYRVNQALDGVSALESVRNDPPDLILLDIMMPGMNGYEVCSRLKDNVETAKIPVVFVTALSETEDKLRAIEAGGDDFLTKPFNRPILVSRIRSLLRLKAANDEVEHSYRKLQALERLKDDLMKMIVHDLKSPLAAILGTLELVTDGDLGPLSDDQSRLLLDARARGDDVLQLIDDLLELTRLEESRVSLDVRPVDVPLLLGELEAEWRVRVQRAGSELRTEAPPGLQVEGDAQLIRRVLGNLVGNALVHGGIPVNVEVVAEALPDDEGVRIEVSDDGVGIADAFHDVIFRKFGSVRNPEERSSRSWGLGLAFCRLAVEAHGGRIWVESREGEGSSFRFTLPRHPQPRPPRF